VPPVGLATVAVGVLARPEAMNAAVFAIPELAGTIAAAY